MRGAIIPLLHMLSCRSERRFMMKLPTFHLGGSTGHCMQICKITSSFLSVSLPCVLFLHLFFSYFFFLLFYLRMLDGTERIQEYVTKYVRNMILHQVPTKCDRRKFITYSWQPTVGCGKRKGGPQWRSCRVSGSCYRENTLFPKSWNLFSLFATILALRWLVV